MIGIRAVLLAGALVSGTGLAEPAAAQPCRSPACLLPLPADAGAINVREFGAKGDGKTDDTAALIAAIAASGPDTGDVWWRDRIVYLPAGTYLVSDTLLKRYDGKRFGSGLTLQGEGVDRTIIRLTDHAPGFQDPATPRGIVMTTSKLIDTGGSRDYVGKGEGNDAYCNFVENLTIDAGADNPGAIGIDYLANNLGAIRNVLVRAPDTSGAVGISMLRQVPGPALIQSARVEGFRTGIALAHGEYGMTLSSVELDGQAETALRNAGNVLSAERLHVLNAGKNGIVNAGAGGLLTLVDSEAGPALLNRGTVVLRHTAAILPGANAPAKRLDGVLEDGKPFRSTPSAWSNPLVTIATVDPGPVRAWAGVTGAPYGKTGDGKDDKPVDVTEAFQRALDSGAHTIYLRRGTFWLSASLRIPATVHRIIGMASTLRVFPHRQNGFSSDAAMLLVAEPGGPLQIERLTMDHSNLGAQIGIRNDTNRPLLMRDIVSAGATMLDRTAHGGPAALENVCCGPMKLAGPAPVTARQYDTEGGDTRIDNAGAPFTIIGLKTEQESTVIRTSRGGRTEIMGGLVYMVHTPSLKAFPIFINHDGSLAASFVEEVLQAGHGYHTMTRTEDDGRVSTIEAATMPPRGLGHMIGLLSAGSR